MATGGSLGNTLFFAISGFCLSDPQDSALQWFKKRLLRIYPSVIIITFIMFVLCSDDVKGIIDVFLFFIYPTQFWFVSAMLLFYLIFFFLVKYGKKYINLVIGLAAVSYASIYIFCLDTSRWVIESGTNSFKWIFYFIVMMLAYQLKGKIKKAKNGRISIIMFGGSVISYFGIKILMEIVPSVMHFQFILHLISLVFMVSCFVSGQCYEEYIRKFMVSIPGKCVTFIGSIAFEIYLVQTFVIARFSKITFPGNLIVVCTLIVAFAVFLQKASKLSIVLLRKSCKRRGKP